MSIQHAYNRWSQTYDSDSNATRDLDRTVLERVLGQRRFESILEIGCGTGKNTELLCRLGERVLALDFSPAMIAKARQKLENRSNLTFTVADITQPWPLEDHCAHLIACNLVLEHVRDLAHTFAEAARVLAQGGIFFISELHPFRQYEGTVAKFDDRGETTRIPAFIHHVSEFWQCGRTAGLEVKSLQEWWHEKDAGKAPRLISFIFERPHRT